MFPGFDIRSCRDKNLSGSFTDNCLDEEVGVVSSVRISLVAHNGFQPSGPVLASKCMSINGNDGQLTQNLIQANIPMGNNNTPFKTVIRSYFGSNDCDQLDDGIGGVQGKAPRFQR